jgi:hypothetical protein
MTNGCCGDLAGVAVEVPMGLDDGAASLVAEMNRDGR